MKKRPLDPRQVELRLEELRQLYVPETREEASARMARALPKVRAPTSADPSFASAVERRLEELRALCELTRYLHMRPRTADE